MTKPTSPTPDMSNDRLRGYVDRIMNLEKEKADVQEGIKDLYTEVKAAGYETKIVRQIIREEKMDASERRERETLLDLYRKELGLIADTPLGKAALAKIA
jgi:uncharacterized protein (UPF0335 family)